MSHIATPAAAQKQKSIASFFSKSATKTPSDATALPVKEKAITPLDKVAAPIAVEGKAAPVASKKVARKPAKKTEPKKKAVSKKPVLCIIDGEDVDISTAQRDAESYSVVSTPPSVYARDSQGETCDAVDIIAASCRPDGECVEKPESGVGDKEHGQDSVELAVDTDAIDKEREQDSVDPVVDTPATDVEVSNGEECMDKHVEATDEENAFAQNVKESSNHVKEVQGSIPDTTSDPLSENTINTAAAAPLQKKQPRRRAASVKKQASDASVIDIDDDNNETTEKKSNNSTKSKRTKVAPEAPPLSATASARVQLINEKMSAAMESLIADSNDESVVQHIDAVMESALAALTTVDTSLMELALRRAVEAVLNRYSSAPLSQIITIMTEKVTRSEDLNALLEPLRLGEMVKSLANRTSYGVRGKTSLVYEDVSPLGLWRWDLHSSAHAPTGSTDEAAALPELVKLPPDVEESIREIKASYGRVGRVVKNYQRVIDEIAKQDAHQISTGVTATPEEAAKLDQLEEKAVKAWGDMERAKDKRVALLKKREADAMEKRRKEQEKLEKQQQKEREQEEKRRAAAEAAALAAQKKEAAAASTKAASNAAVEKQRNMMMQFIKTAAPAPCSTSKASTSCASSSQNAAQTSSTTEFDVEKFERDLETPFSSSELMKEYRQRYANRSITARGKMRPKKSLMVTVTVNQNEFGGLGGSGGYCCEVKEVTVDSRKKLLSFCEDYRPAYFGTFSKKSHLVTGRRPFGLDRRALNYDYDSEAEWEEEDPNGEDLAESDGCSEDDTAESDDGFIRPDDEYDSGIDGDEEEGVRISVRAANMANMREILGVRFLGAEMGTSAASAHDSMSARLMSYKAVVYSHMTTPLRLPLLTTDVTASVPVDGDGAVDAIVATASSALAGGASASSSSLTDDMMRELVRHVHGSTMGMDKLVESFNEKCLSSGLASKVNKSEVRRRITEIASKRRGGEGAADSISEEEKQSKATSSTGETFGRARWIVNASAADKYAPDEVCADIQFTPQKGGKKKRRSLTSLSSAGSTVKRSKTEKSAKLPAVVLDISPEVEEIEAAPNTEKKTEEGVDAQDVPLSKSQKTLHAFLQPTPAIAPLSANSTKNAPRDIVVIPDDDSRHVWGWREEKDCS